MIFNFNSHPDFHLQIPGSKYATLLNSKTPTLELKKCVCAGGGIEGGNHEAGDK